MDPYIAKLIGRPTVEVEVAAEPQMLLKKYYNASRDRVFIRVKGILPPEQCQMLRAEMALLLDEMEQLRAARPVLRRRPDVPMGGTS